MYALICSYYLLPNMHEDRKAADNQASKCYINNNITMSTLFLECSGKPYTAALTIVLLC
jgi:hypothetical protein